MIREGIPLLGIVFLPIMANGCVEGGKAPSFPVWSVAFSPNGNLLAAGSGFLGNTTLGAPWGGQGEIKVWNVGAWNLSFSSRDGFTGRVTAVAFSPNGSTLLALSDKYNRYSQGTADPFEGNWIRVWKIEDKTEMEPMLLKETGAFARQLVFSPKDSLLIVGRVGKPSVALDWQRKRELFSADKSVNFEPHFAISPDGKTILVCISAQPSVQLLSAANGKSHAAFSLDGRQGLFGQFSPDGTMVAVGCNNGSLYLLDSGLTKKIKVLDTKLSRINSLAFAPDGRTIAAAGDDAVLVLELDREKVLHTLRGHPEEVRTIAISPDGSTLAVGWGAEDGARPKDGGVRLWNLKTGAVVKDLQ